MTPIQQPDLRSDYVDQVILLLLRIRARACRSNDAGLVLE